MSEEKNLLVIKHNNGTYYKGWTGIGPCFGATKEDALRFQDAFDAAHEMGRHWCFGSCVVEKVGVRS